MKKQYHLTALIVVSISILFSTVTAFSQNSFERQRVAVVPSEYGAQYTAMVERALGGDKRFEFIDPKQIPAILKEWERRQTGITESDDTSDLRIKNVHFLISIDNVVMDGPNKRYVKNKIRWDSKVRATVKLVKVQEGGATITKNVLGSGSNANRSRSRQSAITSLSNSVRSVLQKLFPIESRIFDVKLTSMKLSRGKSSGVKKGQRYVIKEMKRVRTPRKTVTTEENKAFIQITKADEEISTATIIYGTTDFNTKRAKAVEKMYAGVAFEPYFAAMWYDMKDLSGDTVYALNYLGGFKFLFGSTFQVGWGMNFGPVDRPDSDEDFLKVSFTDLSLRYNMHVVRRFYFFLEATGSYEWAKTEVNFRNTSNVENPNIQVPVDSWTLSGTLGAGCTMILTKFMYINATASYTFASAFDDWKYDEKDAQFAGSTNNYDPYIEEFSPGGFKVAVGLGFYF